MTRHFSTSLIWVFLFYPRVDLSIGAEIQSSCYELAVVFVEISQVLRQEDGEAFLAKSVLEKIGPDIGELCEVHVLACPCFKRFCNAHDFAHEAVYSGVGST